MGIVRELADVVRQHLEVRAVVPARQQSHALHFVRDVRRALVVANTPDLPTQWFYNDFKYGIGYSYAIEETLRVERLLPVRGATTEVVALTRLS